MTKELRKIPNETAFVVSEQPRLEIVRLKFVRGEHIQIRLNCHFYGASDGPISTTDRINHGKIHSTKWHGTSVGFLPAGWHLDAEYEHSGASTFLAFSEDFFRNVAHETLEYRPELFQHMSGFPSPVGYSLIESLRNLIVVSGVDSWPLLTEHIATSIAARVMWRFSAANGNVQDAQLGIQRNRMRRVIDFVEANIHRRISLSEMAGVAALSPFHFARAFRRELEITPVRYVWTRRIERAKVLLRHQDMPIAIIAFDCGFASQSHFTTVFKRETGMTPLQYRTTL